MTTRRVTDELRALVKDAASDPSRWVLVVPLGWTWAMSRRVLDEATSCSGGSVVGVPVGVEVRESMYVSEPALVPKPPPVHASGEVFAWVLP